MGCRCGAVVRALASHQCGPISIPGLSVICGLSSLALYSAPRGFSPGSPVFLYGFPLRFSNLLKKARFTFIFYFNYSVPNQSSCARTTRHLKRVPFLPFSFNGYVVSPKKWKIPQNVFISKYGCRGEQRRA